jgi:hypothetical protein
MDTEQFEKDFAELVIKHLLQDNNEILQDDWCYFITYLEEAKFGFMIKKLEQQKREE